MNSLPDKSHHRPNEGSSDDAPTRIVLGDDPSLFADSHASTVESAGLPTAPKSDDKMTLSRGSSAVVIGEEEKTIISKRPPVEQSPPTIHIGPLESRKALEGETLDHFKLDTYVGGGGMGAVYRAHDTRLNRLVAVKILSRDQSDSETVRRFRNEAQSAARLDHPHIARVYYVGEDKGWNFIVFEFIEGVNIREIVEKQGPLSLEETLDYTLQVAEALEHASARDVVHRDIKPSNVLVMDDGSVKLVDMGLARLHQVESGAEDLTQSGVTLGTFDYISPEQARDPRLADVRSDIYSLGCTLYFMLVGRPPFPEGTALQKLLRHNGDDPPDVRLFRPDTPDEVVALLNRCLAKKPDQRFQTPAELMAAIGRISQRLHLNLGASSSTRQAVAWPTTSTASPTWWQRLLPFTVAALILIGLALIPDSWPGQNVAAPPLPEGKPITAAAVPVAAEIPPAKTDIAKPASKISEPLSNVPPDPERDLVPVDTAPASKAEVLPIAASTPDTSPKIDMPDPDMIATKPVVAKRRVVVGSDATVVDLETELVSTFAAACKYAADHPEVELIELAVNSKLPGPLELRSKRLTIRAASGFSPELSFRPSADALIDERHPLKILASGGEIRFEGIRFRFEVPTSRSPDWALCQLVPGVSLSLVDCVATIVNPSPTTGQQVAFFSLGAAASASVESEDMESSAPPVINLRQCVLRGDATVVKLAEDAPLDFRMSDCFVATRDRLLQSTGLALPPPSGERIFLSLQRSTLYVGRGLIFVGGREDYANRMEQQVSQYGSVVITDPSTPLIEHSSVDASVVTPFSYLATGDNAFPRTQVFYMSRYREDGIVRVDPKGPDDMPSWATTDRPFVEGTLVNPLPTTPTHEQTPADYAIKLADDAMAGCDPALLRDALETASRRPVMGATNMGTTKPDSSPSLMPPIMDDKPTMRP